MIETHDIEYIQVSVRNPPVALGMKIVVQIEMNEKREKNIHKSRQPEDVCLT